MLRRLYVDSCGDRFSPARPNQAVRVAHFAFRANRANFETARRELAAKGIVVSYQDHDISHSIYFSDPDGHRLEITTHEPG